MQPSLRVPRSGKTRARYSQGLRGVTLYAWFVTLMLLPAVLWAQPNFGRTMSAVQGMGSSAGKAVRVELSPVTGLATFIATESERPIPTGAGRFASPEAKARKFLDFHGIAFGLYDSLEARVSRVRQFDEVGMDHVRLQQIYNGVPVTGGEIIVHLRGPNVVTVNAKTLPDLEYMDTVPSLDTSDALAFATELLDVRLGVTDAVLSTPRLELFNRGIFEGSGHTTRLAWFIEATRIDLREFIWVDAHSGAVLLHFSQLPDARDRRIHDGEGTATLPGTLVRSEGEAATGDADADAVYDYSGDWYDYFLSEHARDSYDGVGASMISTVHYNNPTVCPNAFWNGNQTVFCNDFPVADDWVTHEWTHAVTDFSAKLFYYMQSGALNESFSDIFGETVDLINGAGTDTAAVRWRWGEDDPNFGALRNMMDPTEFGDPGKVSDNQYKCVSGDNDNGGVHTNSGVSNHAYALMVDGGSYNGFTIAGIGLTKAAKIQYRALTQYLVSGANFLDNYNAVNQSCTDLIGTAGITVADCTEVKSALDAVEMSTTPCPRSQEPALCPAGQGPNDLFSDNLENITSGNWTTTTITGVNHWIGGAGNSGLYWNDILGRGPFATSGEQVFWGNNLSAIGDSTVEMQQDVPIPANGARMQFNHAHEFDGLAFDGGVLEYSTNSGATWNDAGALISAGATYNGVVSAFFGNPLAGRNAFLSDSFGYTATQLDLTGLAGQNVRFRFRMGTDFIISHPGWVIDDIRIYQCANPVTVITATDSTATEAGPTTGTFTLTRTGSTTSALTVNYTVGGTATSGSDYIALPVSTTIPAGSSSSTITVTPIDDSLVESDETVTVTLSPGAGYIVGSPSSATVIITNNDHTLSVSKSGSGSGSVTSSPAGINCGTDCNKIYDSGTSVTLTASPASDSSFSGWSGGGCSGTGTCTVTMDADKSVTATFNKIPRTLTVTKAGIGTVTSSPAGIDCGSTCSASFDSGTSVTLTANPASGFAFAGFSGNPDCSDETVTMDANKTCTATFDTQHTLTVSLAGIGSGTVTSSPAGINCGNDCSESYDIGTIVTLNATAGAGSIFLGWSGGECSGTTTCTLTLNANTTVTGTFDSPGTSFTFTNDPLTSKVTFVKAKHFLETLEAINTLRQRNGLSTISFTAPIPAAGVPISAKDMITLQTGINAVFDALGRTRPTFDAIIAGVTIIGIPQMGQIRNAIRAVE